MGSLTFALYLFHYPLLSLLSAYALADRWAQLIVSITIPLFIVGTIGFFCERSKASYKKGALALYRAATDQLFRGPAAQAP